MKKEHGVGKTILQLTVGDITKQDTEAVVNAANKRLAPGGGVAGAIHSAAGPELWKECKKLDGCETGEAKITKAYNLPNEYIIHTVGPVYHEKKEDKELLKKSYLNSLKLAEEYNIRSISFPALSTGAFGYPMEKAAEVCLNTLVKYLNNDTNIQTVKLVLYDNKSYNIHAKKLNKIIDEK